MKDLIKSISIFLIPLFISISVYPFLHEIGHLLMAILLGTKVLEINLFPIPNILCENVSGNIQNIFIGFGGAFFPIILSMSIKTKKFWIWYANLILKFICLFSMVISIVSLVFDNKQLFEQDDMRTVLSLMESGKSILLIIILCVTLIIIVNIYKDHLWNNCLTYFQLEADKK